MVAEQDLLNEIEKAILERIRPPLAELDVDVYPGDRRDGVAIGDRDFLCIFIGSRFSDPSNSYAGTGQQDRTMTWQLAIRLKKLSSEGHSDHYPMEQAIVKSLKGFRPHQCVQGALYPVMSRLIKRDAQGHFFYEILVAVKEKFDV
jgi:hypothetical protein